MARSQFWNDIRLRFPSKCRYDIIAFHAITYSFLSPWQFHQFRPIAIQWFGISFAIKRFKKPPANDWSRILTRRSRWGTRWPQTVIEDRCRRRWKAAELTNRDGRRVLNRLGCPTRKFDPGPARSASQPRSKARVHCKGIPEIPWRANPVACLRGIFAPRSIRSLGA